MNDLRASDRDVDRAIRSWLHEDRHEDVSRVAGAVLDRLEATSQRRALWWPAWRTPTMNRIIGFAGAAATLVVVLVVGAQLFGSSSGGVGAQPTPTPSPTASPSPTATAEPSPPPASAPPLTQSYTSTQHGISLSYPEGWTAQAATRPWTATTFPLNFGEPYADWLYDPILESDLFLTIASQPIGDSTPEDWLAEQMASDEGCGTTTEPTMVDGAAGLGADGCTLVVVTTAGRGYWIQLYTGGDDPLALAPYDRAWLEEILATVRLHPEDAVD